MKPSKPGTRVRRVSRDPNVKGFPTPEELSKAWRSYKSSGSQALRNRLIEHYLFLVRHTAERIGAKLPEEVDVDDLMSAGIFGLVDAIDAFDLERGVKFETYCAPRLRGAMLDELRSMDWVPRLVRSRAAQIDRVARGLEAELGRLPNRDEIAARLGLSPEQFERFRRDATAVSQVPLASRTADQDGTREVTEVDVVPDARGSDPVEEALKNDLKEVVSRMSREERLILVLYYYEQMTMKEIGATLDLSESRVSQMHSAILLRLKDRIQPGAETPAGLVDLLV